MTVGMVELSIIIPEAASTSDSKKIASVQAEIRALRKQIKQLEKNQIEPASP